MIARITLFRKKLKLSQRQLAELFNPEYYVVKPTPMHKTHMALKME